MGVYNQIACQTTSSLSKATLLAYLPPKPVVGQTGIDPTINPPPSAQGLLSNLSLSQWDIVSFDPVSRTVCVIIYNDDVNDGLSPSGTVLSFTLVPPISVG